MKFTPDMTYLVECEEDDSALLAMDAKLENGLVEWFDSVRDRAFEVTDTQGAEDTLEVHTERGRTYRFRRLTVELYDEKVKDLVNGHRKFFSTDELQEFYRLYPR